MGHLRTDSCTMKTVLGLLVLIAFVALSHSLPSKRELCVNLCGNIVDTYNITCPKGYTCRDKGCGHQCFRNDDFKPAPGCDLQTCDVTCPLGYKLDKNNCE